MNIPLLRQIAEKAIEFPETFDMDRWGFTLPSDKAHPCGAVGCIAGTAVVLTEPARFLRLVDNRGDWFLAGKNALDLSTREAERLFFTRDWPPTFMHRYNRAIRAKLRARIAVERIEHFIATEGRE